MGRKKEWFPTSRKNAAFFYYLEKLFFWGRQRGRKVVQVQTFGVSSCPGYSLFLPRANWNEAARRLVMELSNWFISQTF